MCNKFKKPTFSAGGPKEFFGQCQKVQKLIHKKCESSLMGAHSGDDVDSKEKGFNNDDEYQEENSNNKESADDKK